MVLLPAVQSSIVSKARIFAHVVQVCRQFRSHCLEWLFMAGLTSLSFLPFHPFFELRIPTSTIFRVLGGTKQLGLQKTPAKIELVS